MVVEPWTLGLVLLVVIPTGGIVCYGLARYLTNPVRQLRGATHKLANGELSVRVGRRLAKRGDELGDLGRDFDLMAQQLEAQVAGQRRLLRDISHELRSPLARLNVALGLARRQSGSDATPSLDRIERESERLNEMIGQLLTISRLESGAQAIPAETVDLAVIVRGVAEDANFEARARGRRVRLTACEACKLAGVPALLRSAVENVVRNAIRYTAEDTEVEVALRPRMEDGKAMAVVSVRDHGPGLPEAALGEIFRPFYRVGNARDRESGGAGLGLAITDRAVRAHKGSARAVNVADGGLLVEILLPLA
jgi:two-component system sensor histidine kinase CpxA